MADDRSAPLTKGDLLEALTQLRQQMTQEIGELRAEMKQKMAQLRAEMHPLPTLQN
jgi:hypothetical protein